MNAKFRLLQLFLVFTWTLWDKSESYPAPCLDEDCMIDITPVARDLDLESLEDFESGRRKSILPFKIPIQALNDMQGGLNLQLQQKLQQVAPGGSNLQLQQKLQQPYYNQPQKGSHVKLRGNEESCNYISKSCDEGLDCIYNPILRKYMCQPSY